MKTEKKYSENEFGSIGALSTIGDSFSSVKLAQMWRSKFGLDVGRFFPGEFIELKRDSNFGHYRFNPVLPGDAEFYASLMRRLGYERADKAEFQEAAKEIRSEDRLLDIGCGTGNFSLRCRGEYRGIELNPAAVEDARKLRRNVHLGAVEEEPNSAYDVVTVFQVVEHVSNPAEFVAACASCVKPGGKIILSTPNLEGVMGWTTNDLLNYPPHHMSWWSKNSLIQLLRSCGCEPESVWEEPLQRVHLRSALMALYWPRPQGHLEESPLFAGVELLVKGLVKLIPRSWQRIPFIKGHTVMVVAIKK